MPSAPDRPSISATQIAASALAASSAAFAASYLGVAGTIIGAAVASVVATVASTMYAASLHSSTAAVRRTAQLVVRPSGEVVPDVIADEGGPVDEHPTWRRTALTAAAVLAITLGSVTGVEAVLGKPLSSLLGGSDSSGTTIGSAVTSQSGGTAKTRVPKKPQSPASTPSTTPTQAPTDDPTSAPTSQPTDQPTSDPTQAPTGEPTTAPAPTDAPTPTVP